MSLAPGVAALFAIHRLRAEAAFLDRLNRGSGFADPRAPTQVHLRDRDAVARLALVALRPSNTHAKAAAAVAAALETALAAAPPSPVDALVARGTLGPAEAALAAIAIAVALDDDTRELVHAMAGRRRPGLYLDVAAELDPRLASPSARLAAAGPRSPLVDAGLLLVDADGGLVRSHPRLAAWALGEPALPPPLDEVATLGSADAIWLPPTVVAEAARIAQVIGEVEAPTAVLVLGPRGSGRRAIAARLAAHRGRPIVTAALPDLLAASGDRTAPLRLLLGEARLRDAVPVLTDADALAGERDSERAALAAIGRGPPLVILAASGRGLTNLPLGRPFHLVRMPRADLDDRAAAWSAALEAVAADRALAPELGGRYVLGPGAIAEVATEAATFARARGGPVDRAALEDAIGRRLSIRLGAYGTLLHRKARFDEMVLPEDVVGALHDMIAMVRERTTILERWDYQRHLGISRGVSALFSGEPGTGKTMAASVVASALGLELIRIDLSQVVSKWVGETEKNLGRIFDDAHDANAMLLFDEADALFGKRTEVKSAQDRHANLEVNYILQRMETFDGVSVLTTNFESSIDPALQRRLNFRIRFPEPEVDERAALWQKLLPPATGLTDAPFLALAERFEMTGGYIKNAVVRAAVIAAREGRELTVDDLWSGAHAEYAEMGKVLSTHTRT